ncbi:MAG: universal stress protein [Alphaproteobacteria bacterium]|nr:universal stress protein [Alphaproteobacteria bacterium]
MLKSILAISEGGPDAAMAFGLAARIAATFGAAVDAVHFSETNHEEIDIAAQAMPFLKPLSEGRLKARRRESERAFHELIEPIAGSTFTAGTELTRQRVVAMGRYANLLLIGRPGTDNENISPGTVRAALYDCARPVVIAPPNLPVPPLATVVVAWNGSAQAARAVGFALPFLAKANTVSIVAVAAQPEELSTDILLRNLARHGVSAKLDTVDHGEVSGRARGRALIAYAKDRGADLLVMGAYGHGQLSNFLGLGGAPAKVISSCPVPLLLAH